MISKRFATLIVAAMSLFLINSQCYADQNKVVIKFGHGGAASKSGGFHNFALPFIKLAAEYSNDKIEIREFPANQLGTEQALFQKIRLQDNMMALGAVNNFGSLAPSSNVFTLPYLFKNIEEVYKLINGPFREALNERIIKESGVRVLGYITQGPRVLTNSKKPICTLEDFQGVKIRTPKNALMIAAYKSWGANPVPMAWAETFTALQQKVVDGQDNPFITNYANKFYEVQKYITEHDYLMHISPIAIGEKYYQSLSREIRDVLSKAVMDAAIQNQKWAEEFSNTAKEGLKKEGMIMCTPTDRDEWIKRARSTWPEFYDQVGGKEVIDMAMEYLQK